MTHTYRGRLTVDLGGKWRLYANLIPASGVALGTVTKDDATGALVYIERTGIYVRLNAGAMVVLPQAKVQAAIDNARAGSHGGAGRGQGIKAADGAANLKRTNITIDPTSADTLRAFGDGDLSLGIRRAAAHIKISYNNPAL